MNKTHLVAALTALLLLSGCGGQASQPPAPVPENPSAPSAPAKPERKTQVLNCPAPASGLDAQVKLNGATYGAVRVGDLAYAVTQVQTATEIGKRKAHGKYVLVTLGVMNLGNQEALTGMLSDYVLVSEGKRYKADVFAGIAYRDLVGEEKPPALNPDLSAPMTFAYEVSESFDPCTAQMEITRHLNLAESETYLLPLGVVKQ